MARTTHLGFAKTNLQRTRVSVLEAPPAPAASGEFPIAGVGASAGGLEAFSEMLAHLPANPGLAVVLVQHLNPHHASALSEVLRRSTAMPVLEARDGLAIQRDRVYVIPPNAVLSLSGNTLRLELRTGAQRSIDIFLQSLAREQGTRAIGVVLSGAATDGTLGLGAIKAAGGITFAQDSSALCDGMPRSAIAAGCVDSILPPDEIACELMRIAAHLSAAGPAPGVSLSPDHLAEICAALRRATGVDFSFHRSDFVGSRVLRRMALRNATDPAGYLERLSAEPGELDGLFEELLMAKSGFFREPGALEYLKTRVYPEMFSTPPEQVRAWVPGCAAGEEVYSLVITLLEHFGKIRHRPRLEVFGTGVHAPSLEKARAGIYPGSIAAEIAPDRLAGFFNAVGSSYQVGRLLRNACVFGRQNVWQDAPFSRLDL
ncbi:MAG TPA: chemotaxis protein CheB, partial [Bryobacteraceae bacterium]|nr:chemotaxis protein CheB [Bryobacteraceae bacterium]